MERDSMKWVIEAIKAQLKCSEEDARKVFSEMEMWFDGRFSELTVGELRRLINDYSYALSGVTA